MSKKILAQSLILSACVLNIPMAFAAPWGQSTLQASPSDHTIPVRVTRSQVKEGMNLLSTAPNGYSLYAEVQQGNVTQYIVKDSSGNVVSSTTSQARGGFSVCFGKADDQWCFDVYWE